MVSNPFSSSCTCFFFLFLPPNKEEILEPKPRLFSSFSSSSSLKTSAISNPARFLSFISTLLPLQLATVISALNLDGSVRPLENVFVRSSMLIKSVDKLDSICFLPTNLVKYRYGSIHLIVLLRNISRKRRVIQFVEYNSWLGRKFRLHYGHWYYLRSL